MVLLSHNKLFLRYEPRRLVSLAHNFLEATIPNRMLNRAVGQFHPEISGVLSKRMTMLSHSTFLAALLVVASSATAAFAQSGSPAGSGMVSPTTIPQSNLAPPGVTNPAVPGATGDARVPGDRSTMAGDSKATIEERTGLTPSGNGGGGR
jgi:hypothetical protein